MVEIHTYLVRLVNESGEFVNVDRDPLDIMFILAVDVTEGNDNADEHITEEQDVGEIEEAEATACK